MPTFYCNYFSAWHSGAPHTRGPLDFAYPAYPIVTPLAAEPPAGSGSEPMLGGQRGFAPLKLKVFWQSCAELPLKYFVCFFLNISMMFTICFKEECARIGTAHD